MNDRSLSTVARSTLPLKPEVGHDNDLDRDREIYGEYSYAPPAVFGFTLSDIFGVLRHRFLTLLLWSILGVSAAVALIGYATPMYAVAARVVITLQDPGKLVDTDSGSSTFIHTQAEVIQSPAVVQEAVAALPRPTYLKPEDNAALHALKSVNASAVTGTRVIALAYLGPDPYYGAALLSEMARVYVSQARASAGAGQEKSLETKELELEALLARIERIEGDVSELRRQNGIVGSAETMAASQLEQVRVHSMELITVRNRRIELQSRLDTGGAQIHDDDPVLRALREELRQAEAELARARATLTSEHPTVISAERDVQVLQGQLYSSARNSPETLQQQIREARRLEAELTALEAQARDRLKVIETYRIDEDRLVSELNRLETLADQWRRDLTDQRLVVRLAEAGDAGIGARMIAEPTVPTTPVWPKPAFILAAGGVLGVTVGFIIALFSMRKELAARVTEE